MPAACSRPDTPAALVTARGRANLEEAFIDYSKRRTARAATRRVPPRAASVPTIATTRERSEHPPRNAWFSPRRMLAYTIREGLELLRDPIRLAFALLGTAFLMAVLAAGISTDVNNLSFAVLDRDNSPESRAYVPNCAARRYFVEKSPIAKPRRILIGNCAAGGASTRPSRFRLAFGPRPSQAMPDRVAVGDVVDQVPCPSGAKTVRRLTSRAYNQQYLAGSCEHASAKQHPPADPHRPVIETRYRYNQDFESIYAMVPSSMGAWLLAADPLDFDGRQPSSAKRNWARSPIST